VAIVHPQEQKSRSPELELLPVQGNISMLAGAGGNITVQVGKDGILLVDTGVAAMTDKVLQAIRTLSNRQITYIINTDERSDHIGGNATIAKIGQPLAIARAAQASVFIVAFSTILDRMSASTGQASIPESAWPNDTYSVPQKNLSFNGEAVQIFHQPATTDGNSIVVFRRSDVISTGDIFDPTQYPIIDVKNGGSLQGVLEGLNRLKQLVVPADHVEGGTMIVPGHGRICDAADLSPDDHRPPGPSAGHDQAGHDARSGEGGKTNRGLRPDLRQRYGQLDDGDVYRGSLQQPQHEARHARIPRE
jgi:glyoxylase-like metal-dependent hydrolase (beta-lactamase superfamily II)